MKKYFNRTTLRSAAYVAAGIGTVAMSVALGWTPAVVDVLWVIALWPVVWYYILMTASPA